MNLIRREPRAAVLNPAFEPFSLMRNLVRWDPFRDFDFQTEASAFMPSFDIKETAEGYVFIADMPGIRQEDLDINLTGNRLSITGKRERDSKAEGENFFISERSFGSFARTFSLPEGVDGNRVNAELKNGVLTLSVPKVPEVQPKKITIQG
jgi:HSP20 family protein